MRRMERLKNKLLQQMNQVKIRILLVFIPFTAKLKNTNVRQIFPYFLLKHIFISISSPAPSIAPPLTRPRPGRSCPSRTPVRDTAGQSISHIIFKNVYKNNLFFFKNSGTAMTTATGRPLLWWRAKEKEKDSCFWMRELFLSISGVLSSLLLERSSGLSINVKKKRSHVMMFVCCLPQCMWIEKKRQKCHKFQMEDYHILCI